jgi:hypothetical protein
MVQLLQEKDSYFGNIPKCDKVDAASDKKCICNSRKLCQSGQTCKIDGSLDPPNCPASGKCEDEC